MPPNTIYVGRPSKWGNPFVVGMPAKKEGGIYVPRDRFDAVVTYHSAAHLWHNIYTAEKFTDIVKKRLKGKNLACWCALDQPCHADVLLEIANEP